MQQSLYSFSTFFHFKKVSEHVIVGISAAEFDALEIDLVCHQLRIVAFLQTKQL